MKLVSKLTVLFLVLPVSLIAQSGVRMSADFLPLEVGNRWVYDLFSENGQKLDTIEFGVQEHRILGGRSFYLLTQFPFVPEGSQIRLLRYDRQERQYMRMIDNDEGPLFLADGTRVEVLQTESSGLPVKFVLHGDLTDLTFQRGMGIIEARMQVGKDVRIAKLTSVHIGDRKAAEAAQQGAPSLPQPPQQPKTPEEKGKLLANNVAKASDETVALDVQVSAAQGGTKFVLTIINTTEKLVPFSFKSSQSYDFAVVDESTGQEIWRWSRRMLFSQVLRQEALRATKNWTFEVVWNHRDNDLNVVSPGKYKVIGSLTSQPPMESESVAFEIK